MLIIEGVWVSIPLIRGYARVLLSLAQRWLAFIISYFPCNLGKTGVKYRGNFKYNDELTASP